MDKKLKEARMVSHQIENINKVINIIKVNQLGILELKSVTTEMKISLGGVQ